MTRRQQRRKKRQMQSKPTDQTGQPGQTDQTDQTGQPGQPGHTDQTGQPGKTGHTDQTGQPGQPGPSEPGPGDDLLTSLYQYDCQDQQSALENKEYWQGVAQKPQSQRALLYANHILALLESPTHQLSSTTTAQVTASSMCFGISAKCQRCFSVGRLGTKCACGCYRMEL